MEEDFFDDVGEDVLKNNIEIILDKKGGNGAGASAIEERQPFLSGHMTNSSAQ